MNSIYQALRQHLPEYLMEAAELGLFMVSATLCTILLYHPGSPVVKIIPDEFPRRVLIAILMGLTLVAIVFSPWGKQSGAHMNPAFTLTFYHLGKISPWDALFYGIAQFAGGVSGVALVHLFAGDLLANPSVNYAPTVPGPQGVLVAFFAEAIISFLLLIVVLSVSNNRRLSRYTGIFAGACVALFIIVEAPLSGMSMNPARTVASAFLPGLWSGIWIYFTAPPLGMLAAATVFKLVGRHVACAKYHHQNGKRCIFCEYQHARQQGH